jgi:AcrR family transcriptional regulator
MPTHSANRPRRQAKQERSRETVEALLEAAARVLQERGYARASTNRIAEVAGASVGTLYEYFANKEAVYEALIQQEIEALVGAVQVADVDLDAPLHELLRQIVKLAMASVSHGPDFLRALEQVPGAVFQRHLANARQSVIAFIRQLLEARREELRVADLDLAAFIVVSAAEGIGANASDDQFGDRLAEEVATLLTLYLIGQVGEHDVPRHENRSGSQHTG